MTFLADVVGVCSLVCAMYAGLMCLAIRLFAIVFLWLPEMLIGGVYGLLR